MGLTVTCLIMRAWFQILAQVKIVIGIQPGVGKLAVIPRASESTAVGRCLDYSPVVSVCHPIVLQEFPHPRIERSPVFAYTLAHRRSWEANA